VETPTGGRTSHSPFTAALLHHIAENRRIEDIFHDVRVEVRAVIAQDPQVDGLLESPVVLNGQVSRSPSETARARLASGPGTIEPSNAPSVVEPPPVAVETFTGGVLLDADRFDPAALGGAFAAVPFASPPLVGLALVPNGYHGEMSFPVHNAEDFRAIVAFKINHGCAAGSGRLTVAMGFVGAPDVVVPLTFDTSDCVAAGGFSATASSDGPPAAPASSPRFGGGDRSVTVVRHGTQIALEFEGREVVTVPGAHGAPLRSLGVRLDDIRREYGPHLTRIEIR
jgi:hypothetical protein